MCVVSNVGDHWRRQDPWDPIWPEQVPWPQIPMPDKRDTEIANLKLKLARAEADLAALKKRCEEMVKELEAAKQQDIEDGNPDCEMDEKVALIKMLCEVFKVDVSKVFA